jgi:hypothetical protein
MPGWGGEQKFVRQTFTLEANNLQNVYILAFFVNFGVKSLSSGGKFGHNVNS